MIRVDAHHHLWSVARGDYGWLTKELQPRIYRDYLPADLAPYLKQSGVEKTILVQAAATVAETEFLFDLAHKTDFIAGVVGWADFAAKDAPATIARLARDKKLLGFRPMLQDLPEDDWILKPALAPALAALRENGLRLDILIFPRHLPVMREFFARHPDLKMVIDHGAKPYIAKGEIEPWKSQITAIARDFPHLCCKLSGLVTEAAPDWKIDDLTPYVAALIEAFGPRRLMWGSDWPVVDLAAAYPLWFAMARTLTAQLAEGDRDEIFGGTAQRFYGI